MKNIDGLDVDIRTKIVEQGRSIDTSFQVTMQSEKLFVLDEMHVMKNVSPQLGT